MEDFGEVTDQRTKVLIFVGGSGEGLPLCNSRTPSSLDRRRYEAETGNRRERGVRVHEFEWKL